jgi:hypothetical protein
MPGLTKKSQKANFTLLTEPVDRIFWGNTGFLVSPNVGSMLPGIHSVPDGTRKDRSCAFLSTDIITNHTLKIDFNIIGESLANYI